MYVVTVAVTADSHVICDIAVCTVSLQHFGDSVTLISACIIIIIIT